jgi:hypothetical protein
LTGFGVDWRVDYVDLEKRRDCVTGTVSFVAWGALLSLELLMYACGVVVCKKKSRAA